MLTLSRRAASHARQMRAGDGGCTLMCVAESEEQALVLCNCTDGSAWHRATILRAAERLPVILRDGLSSEEPAVRPEAGGEVCGACRQAAWDSAPPSCAASPHASGRGAMVWERLRGKGTFAALRWPGRLGQPGDSTRSAPGQKGGSSEKMNPVFARTSGIVPSLIELQLVGLRWRVKVCKCLEE